EHRCDDRDDEKYNRVVKHGFPPLAPGELLVRTLGAHAAIGTGAGTEARVGRRLRAADDATTRARICWQSKLRVHVRVLHCGIRGGTRDTGITRIGSPHSVPQTLERLESLLKERGIMIFARIDFSGDAARAGLTMRPE